MSEHKTKWLSEWGEVLVALAVVLGASIGYGALVNRVEGHETRITKIEDWKDTVGPALSRIEQKQDDTLYALRHNGHQ